jgi:hypothetical protein
MMLDRQTLSRYAPLGLPAAVLIGGWMLLVQPRVTASMRAAREIAALEQQLAGIRARLGEAQSANEADGGVRPEESFAAVDPTSDLLEQLARLAATARVANLMIETGNRVAVSPSTTDGPQVASGAVADPRMALFNVPLAYSPITMSFDAEYERAGNLLWSLRDLATTVEIQDFEARPIAAEAGDGGARARTIHVALTLFPYTRMGSAAASGGGGVLR